MGLSYHIVVPLFLVFALVDIALLSIRALLSHQRHSLTLLYALMGVQEAMLLFELLATLAPLFATFLITAGMWSHIARLYSAFFPLWVLRAFFAAFTMVYKNILIPRWTASLRAELRAGSILNAPGVRAWHAGGYGACVVLDVVICCLYYLAAVYVLGCLSDKTLYVPYHRRRWRHEQLERAQATTNAAAEAAAAARSVTQKPGPSPSPDTSTASLPRQTKRKHDDTGNGDTPASATGGRDRQHKHKHKASHPVPSLARMPSFAQWQHSTQHPATSTSSGQGGVSDAALAPQGGEHEVRGGLPRFSVISSESAGPEGEDRAGSLIDPRGKERAAAAPQQPLSKAPTVRKPRSVASPPGATPLRAKPPTAFLSDLPPLRLSRRFTLNTDGEEGHLNQFAAALVEHGFSTQASERPIGSPSGALPAAVPAAQRGVPPSNSTTAVLRGEEETSAGAGTTNITAQTSTTAPSTAHQSSASNSGNDAALLLRPTGGGAAKGRSSGRASFRRMLSAWSGFKSNSSAHEDGGAEQQQRQQQQPMGSRLASSDDPSAAAPTRAPLPPRRRSTSLVRFALAENGSGDTREDGEPSILQPAAAAAAAAVRGTPPPLPPRPRPSFRIDQATGNVVPLTPSGM